jgi:hypothetical protein
MSVLNFLFFILIIVAPQAVHAKDLGNSDSGFSGKLQVGAFFSDRQPVVGHRQRFNILDVGGSPWEVYHSIDHIDIGNDEIGDLEKDFKRDGWVHLWRAIFGRTLTSISSTARLSSG